MLDRVHSKSIHRKLLDKPMDEAVDHVDYFGILSMILLVWIRLAVSLIKEKNHPTLTY